MAILFLRLTALPASALSGKRTVASCQSHHNIARHLPPDEERALYIVMESVFSVASLSNTMSIISLMERVFFLFHLPMIQLDAMAQLENPSHALAGGVKLRHILHYYSRIG